MAQRPTNRAGTGNQRRQPAANPQPRAPRAPAQPRPAPAAAPATPAAPRPPKAPYTPEQRFRLWVIAAVAVIGLGIVTYFPPSSVFGPRGGPVAGGPIAGGGVTPPPSGPIAGGGTPPAAPTQVTCPVQTVTFEDGPARVVSGLPQTAPTLQGCERVTNMQLSGRCPGHEVHFVSPSGDPRWKYRVNCPTLVKTTT